MECAKYMEAAARQQDSDAKGVYAEQQQNGSAIPNSKDITTTPPVANNPATLHQNDINGSENIEDCEMTEEEMDASSRDLGLAGFDPAYTKSVVQEVTSNGDITVNHAISSNQVTVAGRKRTRETAEGHCYKRQRTAELVLDGSKQQRNGFLNTLSIQANGLNKFPTNMHQLDLLTKTCPITCPVEQTPDVVSGFTNGHSPHVHNGSFHHVGHLADPSNASSSADEHKDSILLAQGYDSMCYEEMLNQCSSLPF